MPEVVEVKKVQFIINFPKTNPIVFLEEGIYDAYMDAASRESKQIFCQQFHENDLISFQFNEEILFRFFKVSLFVNEKESPLFFTTAGNTYMPDNYFLGDRPDNFYERKNGVGVYCFSMRLNNIIDTNKNKVKINDGDNFYFKVSVFGSNLSGDHIFYSNELVLKNDKTGTKLIHYTNKGNFDTSFNTYFDYMPYGYDLRLPSIFLPINQKANKEIFQNYYGTFDLVSAIPYETVKLLIGDENGIGIPDWLIRNLNYIFHCNEKKIDSVDYELVEGSELEVEIVTGYNHRFLQIELCKKDITSSGGGVGGGGNVTNAEVIVKYTDITKESGTITIFYQSSAYLIPTQADFYPYNFSTLITEGNTTINFETVRNTTKNTYITDIEIRDLTTSEVIGTAKLELPPVTIGICNWSICDTFFIKC